MIFSIFRPIMQRLIVLSLFLSSLLFSANVELTPQEKNWIENHKEVIFTGDPAWLPFEAMDNQGHYSGMVSDYLQLVQKKTGLYFELRPTKSWTQSVKLAEKLEVAVISGGFTDEVLGKMLAPIDPYIISPVVIIMDKDKNYVEDLNQLKNKKIAFIKGYCYTQELYREYPNLKFIEVENAQELFDGLDLGEFDAILTSKILAKYKIVQEGYENLKIVGKTTALMELTLFVDKNKPLLQGILNKAMSSISLVDRESIANKWLKDTPDHDDRKIYISVLIVLLILIVVLLINYARIKQLKRNYRYAIEGAKDALWNWNIEKDAITFSPRFKEILGCDDSDFSNSINDWTERIHPDDKLAVTELMKHNIQGVTEDYTIEHRISHKDGTWKWIRVRAKTFFDDKGKALRMDGFCTDITAEKEKELRDTAKAQRLESAQEIGHLGSWEWNIVTGDLHWSDEVYRIFGEVPQSFPATYEAFTSYIAPEFLEGLESAINDAMTSKQPYEYDHDIITKDGSRRLVREAGYIRFNDQGEAVSMLGTVLDINSLLEVKITKLENIELTDLLKKFDENVIASNTDLRGVITYASKAFAEISGYTVDELVGKPQNIVRHPDTRKKLFKDLWEVILDGGTWTGELKNRRKDGSSYWVSNTISPIVDSSGKRTGYSAIRHDLTHEKEAQALHKSLEKKSEELIAFNKELESRIKDAVDESKSKDHLMAQQSKLASMGEMIGNIAHQWRQPLNALGLLLQKQQIFFNKGLLTSEKMKESMDKGTSLIQKMSTTIDDFRDFFKPNKEKVDFNIKSVIDDTLSLLDAALYNQHITLKIDLADDFIIHGYKNEFSQVILNLVNNAKDALIEFKIDKPEIVLNSSVADGLATIKISDNAGGITDKIMEHIFEPYFTTKEEGKGTGIGLYMSKMIIEENMSGSLRVENCEKGACFTIVLKL